MHFVAKPTSAAYVVFLVHFIQKTVYLEINKTIVSGMKIA
jgi:hypothetical protein